MITVWWKIAMQSERASRTKMIDKIKPEIIGLIISACVSVISVIAAFSLGYSMLGWLLTIPIIGIIMCSGFIVYVVRR